MAMVFVFLVLAAQYESWAVPFSVLLGLPICVFGAFLGVSLVGLENNVYVQIGIVALMGLAAKNAILIVEFAKEYHEKKGMSLMEAAAEGARLRFRPIMMTAFAFILGVVPLVIASGAGAAARVSIGIAVFAGMLMASTVGLFFIPMLYVLIQGGAYLLTGNRKAVAGKVPAVAADPGRTCVMRRKVLIACGTLALTGCMVGPNYKRPDTPAPPQFRAGEAQPSTTSLGDMKWFDLFQDEILRELIKEALQVELRHSYRRSARAGCGRPACCHAFPIISAGGRASERQPYRREISAAIDGRDLRCSLLGN